jgi:hypothetical protein
MFIDICPENDVITKQNFLTLKLKKPSHNIHIIGNPPFGFKSSIAKQFIEKCCDLEASSVSFILPIGFKKKSYQKVFPLNYHLCKEINLTDNSFIVDDIEYDVDCIFQIWQRRTYKRRSIKNMNIKPIGFYFIDKFNNPDISIRRVGSRVGIPSAITSDKNTNTHYFIKFDDNINKTEMIDKLHKIKYENYNIGPKSISKQQIIQKINKIIKNT